MDGWIYEIFRIHEIDNYYIKFSVKVNYTVKVYYKINIKISPCTPLQDMLQDKRLVDLCKLTDQDMVVRLVPRTSRTNNVRSNVGESRKL